MTNIPTSERFHHITEFGKTLIFTFLKEDVNYYPQICLFGQEGTSATLLGQCMSPDEIENLGLALMRFAAKLRAS